MERKRRDVCCSLHNELIRWCQCNDESGELVDDIIQLVAARDSDAERNLDFNLAEISEQLADKLQALEKKLARFKEILEKLNRCQMQLGHMSALAEKYYFVLILVSEAKSVLPAVQMEFATKEAVFRALSECRFNKALMTTAAAAWVHQPYASLERPIAKLAIIAKEEKL